MMPKQAQDAIGLLNGEVLPFLNYFDHTEDQQDNYGRFKPVF